MIEDIGMKSSVRIVSVLLYFCNFFIRLTVVFVISTK